jgi:hypothetical protein
VNRIELERVDRVEITVLMDNVTGPLLVDREAVQAVSAPLFDPSAFDPSVSERG